MMAPNILKLKVNDIIELVQSLTDAQGQLDAMYTNDAIKPDQGHKARGKLLERLRTVVAKATHQDLRFPLEKQD